MKNPKFQVFKSLANEEFYYRLKAINGEVILSGEGYKTKHGCLNGISSVKINAPDDYRYDRRRAVTNEYYFNLIAVNGEIIGRSEMYTTRQGMETGISAIKTVTQTAPIEDLT